MSDVIFPTTIPDWTPASNDKFLFSDASDSNLTKDGLISDLPVSDPVQAALDLKEDLANKGAANGYAPLDATGKIPTANLPDGMGTGDVVWPASAVDSHFAEFDSTTWKLIKDGGKSSASFAKPFTVTHVTATVSPAIPQTAYLVDASAGAVSIVLPNASNSTDEYRVVLEENSHAVSITTAGWTQLIGWQATQKLTTVWGALYLRASTDHYDVISDTRQLLRKVDVSVDTDVSAEGFENATVYHCIPAGGTLTFTVPDAADSVNGSYCTFTIHGTGSVIVKTASLELIEGQAQTVLTEGAFQLVCLGDHYAILQDSRAKVQNASLTTYSLSEDSAISDGLGGFYKQSCTSTTDSRYSASSTVVNTGTIGADTYVFGAVSDAGVIQGTLPEWPAESVVNVARNTGSASFRFYVKFYHRNAGGTETLIGTSSLSNVIDTSTIAEYRVNASLAQTEFTSTDRIVRKVFCQSAGSPTAKISVEGSVNSFSQFSVGSTSIAHNAVSGLQGGNASERYHLTAAEAAAVATIAWKADLSGATFTGDVAVPDEAYDATAWNGNMEVPTKNAVRDKIESLGGSGWPSIVAEYSTAGVPVAGVAFEKSGRAFTVTSVLTSLATLPVWGNFEVNVKKNGTTILSGNLTITTTESASNSLYVVQTGDAGKATVSTTSFSSKDRLTIEVVAGSGNTFLGARLDIQVVGTIS